MKQKLLAATALIAIIASPSFSTAAAEDNQQATTVVSGPEEAQRLRDLMALLGIPWSDPADHVPGLETLSSADIALLDQMGLNRSTALGFRASATKAGSIALGALSVANEEFVLSLGRDDNPLTDLIDESIKRRIAHVAAGIDDTDAVNVFQLRGVEQKVDINTEDLIAAKLSLAAHSGKIFDLEFSLTGLQSVFDYVQVNSSGQNAIAKGMNAIAIGEGARAEGAESASIGTRAKSLFNNAFAFGAGVQTRRDNHFAFGTGLSTYTMPGLTSPRSTKVQLGPLELVTVDRNGNLAGDGGFTVRSLSANIAENTLSIGQNDEQIADLQLDLREYASAQSVLEETVQSQKAEIDQNRLDIDAGTADLKSYRADIDENAETIDETQQALDTVRSRVAANESGLVQVETILGDHDVRLSTTETKLIDTRDQLDQHTQAISDHGFSIQSLQSLSNDNQTRIARNEQSIASNAETIQGLQTDVSAMNGRFDALSTSLVHAQENIERNTAGIAIANALAGSTWLQSNERVALSANWGHFDGQDAFAVSGAARLNKNLSANASIGAMPDRSEYGARAGVRLGW
ncbi:MAG: YadA-like family protein [Pseudomonadota bacterium]